ncbi:MAG TPA: SIS domain-containing protein [Actinomycetota bacterium]|nr:SIS domain-containing protein [Actinomycetota bacterium]
MTIFPAEQTLMAADMAEQPAVLRALIARRDEIGAALKQIIPTVPRGFALVGRGSSENAAQYGRIVLEMATGVPVTIVPPSLVRLYGTSTEMRDFVAIGISQSGYTPEIAETISRLKLDGAVAVGITSDPASPLAAVSDLVVDLQTSRERAVPATKTFTAELAALAIIAEHIGVLPLSNVAWYTTVGSMERVLADVGPVMLAASRLHDAHHVFTLAAGASAGLAHEAALKIMEASGIAASGFSGESFRHGPIAIAGPLNPVIAIAPAGPSHTDVMRVCETLIGVPSILIAHNGDIPLSDELPETLGVIPAAIRIQQLALELARRRGVNPDAPPHTQKVLAS